MTLYVTKPVISVFKLYYYFISKLESLNSRLHLKLFWFLLFYSREQSSVFTGAWSSFVLFSPCRRHLNTHTKLSSHCGINSNSSSQGRFSNLVHVAEDCIITSVDSVWAARPLPTVHEWERERERERERETICFSGVDGFLFSHQ